ncbi:hypothetical protein HY003_02485 [Candidatus Saccharibacteria bacterium]|nr:hypothetical protein [Candidatus Saccharibacteria bacterium]MBI3338144.1 hypothetical protein [Candidatus Saccharibacteria bacterium]
MNRLDLRKIARSQGELARAKIVLSEDTSRYEKLFASEVIRSSDRTTLYESSRGLWDSPQRITRYEDLLSITCNL